MKNEMGNVNVGVKREMELMEERYIRKERVHRKRKVEVEFGRRRQTRIVNSNACHVKKSGDLLYEKKKEKPNHHFQPGKESGLAGWLAMSL